MTKFQSFLFIDDDHFTNAFHDIVVETSGLCDNSTFIEDPLQGIAFFKDKYEQGEQLPQVLFLDINMPKMNGWEFIDALKQLAIRQLPIIVMLSTSTYQDDIDKAMSIPEIYKYLSKPLTNQQLEELLEDLKDQLG